MVITAEDRALYQQIKKDNDKKIERFCKKHDVNVDELKKNIKYCLYENLNPIIVCDKKKLNGIASIYRYHFRRLCVIQYKIKYIGKCYVPVIIEISTEEKAHKSYKRNVKKR